MHVFIFISSNSIICYVIICIFRWQTVAQYFPRRSYRTIKRRWQVIDKIKSSDNADKSKNEYIKKRAAALLNLGSISKLLLQESNGAEGLSRKRSIPNTMASEENFEKKSNLFTKGRMCDGETLTEAENNGVCPPNTMSGTGLSPIEFPFQLDLSDEDINTFMESPHVLSNSIYTWNALSI